MNREIKKDFVQAGFIVITVVILLMLLANTDYLLQTGFGQTVVAIFVIAAVVFAFRAYSRFIDRKKQEWRSRREARLAQERRAILELMNDESHKHSTTAVKDQQKSRSPAMLPRRRSGGGPRCPVCGVSKSDARTLLKHVSSNYVIGIEREVLARDEMSSMEGFYFCIVSAALHRLPHEISREQYLERFFPRLRAVQGLGHHAVVNLSPWCVICRKNRRDSLFLEFVAIRESGGSHMVGDPSVHCTMEDIRWMADFDTFDQITLSPIHETCSEGRDVLPYHMGNLV